MDEQDFRLHLKVDYPSDVGVDEDQDDQLAIFKKMFMTLDGKLNLIRDRLEVVEKNME